MRTSQNHKAIVKPLPVLMTASISTRGMKNAYYSDDEREQMYVESLNFYIENVLSDVNQSVVFVDNSGWNLDHLKRQLLPYDPNRLSFVSLSPELFDITKGKGYNELLMMNMALCQSQVIQESGGFVKATGRYPIYNLPYFVKMASCALEKGAVMYCDIKDHRLYDILQLGWTGHSFYSVLYGVKNVFFLESIGARYEELNDYTGPLVEEMVYKIVMDESKTGLNKWRGTIGGGRIVARFKKEPICGGLQGSRMSALSFSVRQNNWKSKIKRGVGNCFRRLFPWIWF